MSGVATVNPHLTWPLQFAADGDLAEHTQHSAADILNSVHVVGSVTIGTLEHDPEFGIPDVSRAKLRPGVAASLIGAAIRAWEQRAPIIASDSTADGDVDVDIHVDTRNLIPDTQDA